MFGKSFKVVFGIGAGVVATLTLAAAAIGLAVWVFQQFDSPRVRAEAQLSEFTRVCDPPNAYAKYKRGIPTSILDAIPESAKRDELDWLRMLKLEFDQLDAFRAVCTSQGFR